MRILLAIAAFTGAVAKQFDISVAFLRTTLKEKVFMAPPAGVELPPVNGKRQCYLCKKSIYGLKQSSHGWYHKCTRELFLNHGWSRCPLDSCVFIKRSGIKFVIAALFVDDALYISNWPEELKRFEANVQKTYQVKQFDNLNWFLGMKIERDFESGKIMVSQKQFVIDAAKRYGLDKQPAPKTPCPSKHVFEAVDPEFALDKARQKLYMEKVGTLNYIATAGIRGDVAWVTSKLGMFMQQADESHMKIADRVIMYLAATCDYQLVFDRKFGLKPVAYSDASFADEGKTGTNGRRRSQSGCCIHLCGPAVVYHSRGQKNVALSTAESEYVALSGCVQEVIWVRRMLQFLGFGISEPTTVFEDNEAAQALANNDTMTKKSRFVDTRFHYTREMVNEGEIEVKRCDTQFMTADIFTKAMSKELMDRHGSTICGGTPTLNCQHALAISI